MPVKHLLNYQQYENDGFNRKVYLSVAKTYNLALK